MAAGPEPGTGTVAGPGTPPAVPAGRPGVAVLVKRVDLRPSVDPLSGDLVHDPHGGLSAADKAAVELALRLGERHGTGVLAVSAGDRSADTVLRQALEAGAVAAVRVDLPPDAPSAVVARALAPVLAGVAWVCCGDYSLDRGSGSVPAFVAGELAVAQALGAAAVDLGGDGPITVERRLDGGRREVLAVEAPAVVSVESGVVSLRRPPLAAALAARRAEVTVVPAGPHQPAAEARTRPYRPRPRVLDGPDPALPARDRLVALSGALVSHDPPRIVRADAEQAADELLAFLAARGYLADPAAAPATDPAAAPATGPVTDRVTAPAGPDHAPED